MVVQVAAKVDQLVAEEEQWGQVIHQQQHRVKVTTVVLIVLVAMAPALPVVQVEVVPELLVVMLYLALQDQVV
jgi:hypothetical protein